MLWLGLIAFVLLALARPVVRMYRSAEPTIVESVDAADRPTALDDDDVALLEAAGFDDAGAHRIEIARMPAMMHCYQRGTDGTIVTGLSQPDGSFPAYYVTTLLAEGRGWLETRTTDRTPGPRGELMQVLPDASLQELVESHGRALQVLTDHGVRTVRGLEPVELVLHQAATTRKGIRHNPVRFLVGIVAKSAAPDRPKVIAADGALGRRLQSERLA